MQMSNGSPGWEESHLCQAAGTLRLAHSPPGSSPHKLTCLMPPHQDWVHILGAGGCALPEDRSLQGLLPLLGRSSLMAGGLVQLQQSGTQVPVSDCILSFQPVDQAPLTPHSAIPVLLGTQPPSFVPTAWLKAHLSLPPSSGLPGPCCPHQPSCTCPKAVQVCYHFVISTSHRCSELPSGQSTSTRHAHSSLQPSNAGLPLPTLQTSLREAD